MDLDFIPKVLPKDARWQDLISKLRCPQCQTYQGSSLTNLERHVLLHCKCRPILIKNHYIRKLKQISSQANEDVIDFVRLTLEAKLLQWSKEGSMPEIPLLLRHNENQHAHSRENHHFSKLLDAWRLWQQEMDSFGLEYNAAECFQLMTEAEGLEWEIIEDNPSPVSQEDSHSFNLELMSQVSTKLKEMYSTISDDMSVEDEDIDFAAIERLEREASRFSTQAR